MKLGPTLRTLGIFLAVGGATFVATDPAALPDWAKALIGAGIAGLAAVGITPPLSAAPAANAVYRQFDQVQTQLRNLHVHIGTNADAVDELADAHAHLADAHEQNFDSLELQLNGIQERIRQLEKVNAHALTVVPPPEPPAPEVPS